MATNRTVLITGASSGIGLELARLFAKHGHDLVLVARSHERLKVIGEGLTAEFNIAAMVIEKDLSRPGAAASIVQGLAKKKIDVDILVNNAGFGGREFFAEGDLEHDQQMIQVNISAINDLTRLLLPGMIKRGSGRVLNVASTAAFIPGAYMAVYHATKSYVLSFSRAIAVELEDTGVTVSVLCPGPVKTAWAKEAGLNEEKFNKRAMSVNEVARVAYEGMMKGDTVIVPGFKNRIGAFFAPYSRIVSWGRRKKNVR